MLTRAAAPHSKTGASNSRNGAMLGRTTNFRTAQKNYAISLRFSPEGGVLARLDMSLPLSEPIPACSWRQGREQPAQGLRWSVVSCWS